MTPRLLLVAFVLSGCVSHDGERDASPSRSFTIEDAQRLTLPFHAVLSPDGRWVAYNHGDSLYVAGTNTEALPVALAGGIRAQSSYAWPYMSWSHDGSRLVFRADDGRIMLADRAERSVRPLLPDSVSEGLQTFNNLLAGGPSWSPDGRRVALPAQRPGQEGVGLQAYVFDFDSGVLEPWTDEPVGVFSISWSPDGRWLAYSCGRFVGDSGAIRLLDVESGSRGSARSVVDGGSAVYLNLLWSPDSHSLLARTRTGEPALFRIQTDGSASGIPSQLPGRVYVAWVSNGAALLTSVREGMSRRLERVDLSSGRSTPLTGTDTLTAAVGAAGSSRGDIIAYTQESGSMPPRIMVAEYDSLSDGLISRRNLSPRPAVLDSVALARHQIFGWTSPEGDRLETQLFLPPHPGPLPPLVIMPYGAYMNKFPRGEYFVSQGIQALTARGYAVALPNTRGIGSAAQSDGRYGATQLEDTHALLDALAHASLADTSRVAVLGHSHGGAMAYYYGTHSKRFDAIIAVNGAADWVEQAKLLRMAGLPNGLGGTPEDLPEKYRAFSPLDNADAMQAPLLAFAGRRDTQIPSWNAEVMVDSLRSLGRDATLHIFEDEGHLIETPANQRQFWQVIFDFLSRTL